MTQKSYISGVGTYLPKKIISNDELSKIVDTSNEWIVKRTGINQRHQATGDETCTYMASESAKNALLDAGLTANDIDGVIVATCSPDSSFPSVASMVCNTLGITKGFAFDISAACAGFIFGLNNADNQIRLNQASNILVIGAELLTKMIDWEDRNTCVLFGDGAGAIVVSSTMSENHILSTHIYTDAKHTEDLATISTPNDPEKSRRGVKMDGLIVYKFAVGAMFDSVMTAVNTNGYNIEDIDWLVPHQANIRIIESVAEKLNVPKNKAVISLQNHANTSAATIPLALGQSVKNNDFKSGDLIALTAMGAGFCWGSALLRWK